jgi:hypothetical protein
MRRVSADLEGLGVIVVLFAKILIENQTID